MNPNIKKLWVDALRSGRYKRGTGRLRNHKDKFCCLGVLCDLYVKETGSQWEKKDSVGYSLEGETDILPSKVMKWSGISNTIVSYGRENENCDLAYLNDTLMMSFSEIADLIESQL